MTESKTPRHSIPWLRVLAEGGVMVVSILLALAADAWWDGVKQRKAEVFALQQLSEEFSFNAEELEDKSGTHQRALDASLVLLDHWGTPEGGFLPPDSLDTLLTRFLTPPTYDPSDGALLALNASGGLELIGNDSLRVALAGWPTLVRDLNEDEVFGRQDCDERIIPYLNRNFDWMALTSGSADDTQDLFHDRVFNNMVEIRRWRLMGLLNDLREVEENLALIRRLIGQELGR